MKLVGHQESLKIIRLFLDKNYSSYSFLFEGKDCIGKKLAALVTARAFLCEKGYGFGCTECSSCRLVNNTISNIYEDKNLSPHPDLMVVSPEKEIKIDQIRQIISFLKLKSKKVVIIEKAEKMNREASNALLKTLEEPPENSMIILTTSNQNAVLPTILSRCKKIKFRPLKTEEIKQIIQIKNMDSKREKIYLSISDGSMCLPEKIEKDPNLLRYAKDLYNLIAVENIHPEGIITLSEIFDKLENEKLETVLEITGKILYKKTLKGEINPDIYDRFIKEFSELKTQINRGVKKKLCIEGVYFNIKGG